MGEVSGGAAVERLLKQVDPDERLTEIREELPRSSGTRRTALHREARYLAALSQGGLRPDEAYIIKKLPVVPAALRPVYADDRGTLISSDLNELYRDVGALNEQISSSRSMPEKHKADLRRDLYDGVAAVQGLGDPVSDNTKLKGIFRQLSGLGSPKGGHFQSKVIRSRQNVSARSTIALGNDLSVDQVGMPEEMAWTLYRDFAVRELVGLGYKKAQAMQAIRDRSQAARQAIEKAMAKRPVWLNRSPSLHRHSIMALEPVMTSGRAIRINPLITKGFNADFDGDTMSVHVPVGQDAIDETKNNKPSDILFAAGQDKLMMTPSQSSALGLYYLSKPKGTKPVRSYTDPKKALADASGGQLDPEDPITLRGRPTTAGRLQIDALLPSGLSSSGTLDKKGLNQLLTEVARKEPKRYGSVVHNLRVLGDRHATLRGFSIGLDDLTPLRTMRDRHMAIADRKAAADKDNHKLFTAAYGKASDDIEKDLMKILARSDNSIGAMMLSGSRGSPPQARQIFASPVIAQDPQGNVVPVPIRNSYADGLSTSEYFSASFGARAGAVGRSHQTSLPGALAKEVLSSVSDAVISTPKSKDMPSIELTTDEADDVLGRYTSAAVRARNGRTILQSDQPITPQALAQLRKHKVSKVKVYTPLNATVSGGGLPAMAYGTDESGQLPAVGTNIGILSGHAMTEPISQMTLDAFHSGATGGTRGRISKFDRIRQIFSMPENLPDKASIAHAAGRVETIKKSPVGGWDVSVGSNKERHYVNPNTNPVVKEGDVLALGDRISTGPIKPQELLKLKGLDAAQDYLVEEIKKETGVNRRAAEVVVGSMTDHAQVVDADPLDDLLPGDVVPAWKLKNKMMRTKAVDPHVGVGRALMQPIGSLKPGHVLTKQDADRLTKKNVEAVEVQLKPPKGEPILRGVNMLPLVKAESDWVAGMGFRRLKDVISEGVLRGRSSDIHAYNPIPALAYGAEFGQGDKGMY